MDSTLQDREAEKLKHIVKKRGCLRNVVVVVPAFFGVLILLVLPLLGEKYVKLSLGFWHDFIVFLALGFLTLSGAKVLMVYLQTGFKQTSDEEVPPLTLKNEVPPKIPRLSWRKICLRWSVLNKLYSGIIGKAVFIVSIISFLSSFNIPILSGIISTKFQVPTWGSIVLIISFVLFKIRTPDVHRNYNSHNEYYDNLKNDLATKTLSLKAHFKILEINVVAVNNLEILENEEYNLYSFESIDKYIEVYKGRKKAIYPLSLLKYEYSNLLYRSTRLFLSVSYYVGILMMFFITICNLYKFITKA